MRSLALPRSFRRITILLIGFAVLVGMPAAPAAANDPVVPADRPRLDRPSTSEPIAGAEVAAPGDFSVPNFQEEIVLGGLTQPIVLDFAADGRVFVGEKSGLIKVFDSLSDPTASVYADIRTNVHDFWDRGLLGMALDPSFTTNGRLYVAYAYNAAIGATAPRWSDGNCPSPPGATTDGCVISGRVSVIVGGTESVLVNDWCQQFPSHSMSDIVFDLDGALIVNGGDGASFNASDYGQFGGTLSGTPTLRNPCGDPPGGVGGEMTLPSAEGGALRSQDIRSTSDPVGLSGSVIRIDRMTGAAMADNPTTTGSENAQRIIGYGLRNPFRLAVHPVSGELWIGDVGWSTTEEINRHSDPDGVVRNFGWPCREGASLEPGLYGDAALCESMSSWTAPHFAYDHDSEVVAGDGCSTGGSISGMAFYAGGGYPDQYDNALFFADYSRQCLWVMESGADGVPDAGAVSHFADLANPVHLTVGPGGDLYYVDLAPGQSGEGTIRRIRHLGTNNAPTAAVDADPVSGGLPLTVDFDASGSSDPDDDPLTYAWDFGNDDGQFNDAFGVAPSHTYSSPGSFLARVRVSDGHGGTDVDEVTIDADNAMPTATIDSPSSSFTWSVGQEIGFSGSGTDPDEGTLPASALSWDLILAHCPDDCHEHPVSTLPGTASGNFPGPDHEYPSHLILRLTVEDEHGSTDSAEIVLQPKTVTLEVRSNPSDISLTAGWVTDGTPFTLTVISGSSIQLSAPSGIVVDGFPYAWDSWSDGGDETHTIVATAPGTYMARYSGGFADVPVGAPFRADIAWLVRNEITSGCDEGLYCPTAPVTRGQMASFLVRTLGLVTGGSPDQFTDIASSTHRTAINRLAAAGITSGCSETKFCPNQVVTRAQMASFLVRALGLSGSAPDAFGDDDGLTHENNINLIAEAGVTSGCAPNRFCPSNPVTRGQMAAFLHRAFADRFPE